MNRHIKNVHTGQKCPVWIFIMCVEGRCLFTNKTEKRLNVHSSLKLILAARKENKNKRWLKWEGDYSDYSHGFSSSMSWDICVFKYLYLCICVFVMIHTTWTERVFFNPILQTLGWETIFGWLEILEGRWWHQNIASEILMYSDRISNIRILHQNIQYQNIASMK